MRDGWRLALGTFTAVRGPAPAVVDGRTLGQAMLLAPATALLPALVWTLLGLATAGGVLPGAVAALLALGAVALLSRALHLDGLADLADGLTAGHDPDRSLDVMRRGDTGPAGAAALVLVLGLDAAALTTLLSSAVGSALAASALLSSRLAPAVLALRGTPAARQDGLGRSVAGTVARPAACAAAAATTALGAAAVLTAAAGEGARAALLVGAVVTVLAGPAAALALRRHAVRRLGGITGDVIGAAVEASLATSLVAATVVVGLTSR